MTETAQRAWQTGGEASCFAVSKETGECQSWCLVGSSIVISLMGSIESVTVFLTVFLKIEPPTSLCLQAMATQI